MKNILLAITLIVGSVNLSAQQVTGRVFVRDANGLDMKVKSATIDNIEFLFHPTYLNASLFAKTGKLSSNVKYKLLLQENRLFYLEADGSDMEVVSPIYRVEFDMPNGAKTIFERDFPAVDALDQQNYYQVLSEGKAKLLLDTKFEVEAKQVFGSGTVSSTEKKLTYYGCIGTKIVKLNNVEQVLRLMEDRSADITTFINKEKIKLKKQSDLEKLFNYYNQASTN